MSRETLYQMSSNVSDFVGGLTWCTAMALFLWRVRAFRRHYLLAAIPLYASFFFYDFVVRGAGLYIAAGDLEWGQIGLTARGMLPAFVGCLGGCWLGASLIGRIAEGLSNPALQTDPAAPDR